MPKPKIKIDSRTHASHTMTAWKSDIRGDRFASTRVCSACEGAEAVTNGGHHYNDGDSPLMNPCPETPEGTEFIRVRYVRLGFKYATDAEILAECEHRGLYREQPPYIGDD